MGSRYGRMTFMLKQSNMGSSVEGRSTISISETASIAGRLPAAPLPAHRRLVDGVVQRATSSASYQFFSEDEAMFVEAVVDALIPADASGPGAIGGGILAHGASPIGPGSERRRWPSGRCHVAPRTSIQRSAEAS